MERIIKFRAWDGTRIFHPSSDAWFQLIDGSIDLPKNTVLMQFTGLSDKNGKEIYEGDFIRMKQVSWAYAEHLMLVQWSEEYSSFQAMVVATLGNADGTAKVGIPYSMSVASKHGEVIGNFRENPELLTQPKSTIT